MHLIITSIVFLVFLQNLCLSRTSLNEDSEWVKDMLQLGSRNGNPSLKAPIISSKNREQGRTLTRRGKGRLSTNLSPSGGDDGGAAANSNSDMKQPEEEPEVLEDLQNSQRKYEGPKVTIDRHYDEEEFQDAGPDNTMKEPTNKDTVNIYSIPGRQVYIDGKGKLHGLGAVSKENVEVKISGRIQNRNSKIYVPLKEQQRNSNDYSMVNIVGDSAGQLDHLSMGNPYFYPIQENRLVRWRNQENVLVGAYKKLTNINRERLLQVNSKSTS